MKTSFAAVALALSGSAMGAPFSNGTRPAFTSSPRSTSAQVSSTDPPLPNPFASSSTGLPSGTPSSGAPFPSGGILKRGEALSIPTDLPSLVSDAQSVAAALASAGAGAQKRGDALSIPTDLPSLLADAQSVGAAIASAGAQKRSVSEPIPTLTPTGTPSTPRGTAVPTPSSTVSTRPASSASATPVGSSSAAGSGSSSGRPLPTPTGVSPFSQPLV